MQLMYQFQFTIAEGEKREILIAQLESIGFEGFEERENELIAYISLIETDLHIFENKVKEIFKFDSLSIINEKNWNEVWESEFQPVTIKDLEGNPFVYLRADFHEPNVNTPIELIITPRMSFGTGHHATTSLMISSMKELDFKGKTVMDFGTGTGVLAILAEKLGASSIYAIDNDEWSINNAADNIMENHSKPGVIELEKADEYPSNRKFDIILANINLNVILENLGRLCSSLIPGGTILLSGLLEKDEDAIRDHLPVNFKNDILVRKLNDWLVIRLKG